jgi:hypothetical protein
MILFSLVIKPIITKMYNNLIRQIVKHNLKTNGVLHLVKKATLSLDESNSWQRKNHSNVLTIYLTAWPNTRILTGDATQCLGG